VIIAAAVKLPGKPPASELILHVPAPGRHHNVLHSLWHQFIGEAKDATVQRTHASYSGEIQGFLTDKGEFLDRRAALIHARECGQALKRQPGVGYQGDELFSEDLW
jgi:hypothetical protein